MVTLADYVQHPRNGISDGIEGWPVTSLARPTRGTLPAVFVGECIVTAKWGWAEVPAPVKSACLMLASENLKAAEVPFGLAGFEGTALRIGRLSPLVRSKLQPYRRGTSAVVFA